MLRIALVIFLVLAALLALRVLRLFVSGRFPRPGGGAPPGAVEGEMVRDPICGTWIDRRLALAAKSSGEWVPVCSEKCRSAAESA